MKLHSEILIVGCGDIGQRVAASEIARGRAVEAVVKTETSRARLEARGIRTHVLDLDQSSGLERIEFKAETLFYFAPPAPKGVSDPRLAFFLDGLQKASRIIYISTSGVYGDSQGAWVHEETPPSPGTDRAKRRLDAEHQLQCYAATRGCDLTILRVPGIYSPERLPIERIQRKTPVVLPEQAPYSNRIHAEDLSEICIIAASMDRPSGIYNASDGHPTTMTDYFWHVADYLNLERPPAIPLQEAMRILGPNMASFLEESRRLSNLKLIEQLGVVLRYPSLRDGLPIGDPRGAPALG